MALINIVTVVLLMCIIQLVLGGPLDGVLGDHPPPHEDCNSNQVLAPNHEGDLHCVCKTGYFGRHCEEFSCLNGGHFEHHGHKCRCLSGFFGQRCEHECKNGGRYDKVSGKCHCTSLYTGTYCTTDHTGVSLCSSSTCQHGHCYHDSNSYFCYCSAGYTGTHCDSVLVTQQPTTVCHGAPCKNGGHCYHDNVEYYCNCPANYTGKHCETLVQPPSTPAPVDFCAFGPCVHGICLLTKSKTGFYCYCEAAYTGDRCETEITGCSTSPCLNNGHCYDDHDMYVCVCQAGFTGVNCETNITDTTTASGTLLPLTIDPNATFAPAMTTRGPQFEVCNEIEIILGLGSGRVNHSKAGICSNGNHKPEAVQLKYCSANNVTSWKMGVKVLPNCNNLPKYVAIAQFHNGVMTTDTAVFVVCTSSDELQVFRQTCTETFKLTKVAWPESETFYTLEW